MQEPIKRNLLRNLKRISKPQKQLFELVKSIYKDAELEYGIDGKYYLDIFIPSLNLDIEYDGSYWHQDEEKDNVRDVYLKNKGIQIIRYKGDIVPNLNKIKKDILGEVK